MTKLNNSIYFVGGTRIIFAVGEWGYVKKHVSYANLSPGLTPLSLLDPYTGSSTTRRKFLERFGYFGLAISASSFNTLGSPAAPADTSILLPDDVDLAIAEMGQKYAEVEPESAALIAVWATNESGLSASESINWKSARRSYELLTEPSRVSQELLAGEVVFVDGWLLARSEIGSALLFTKASMSESSFK